MQNSLLSRAYKAVWVGLFVIFLHMLSDCVYCQQTNQIDSIKLVGNHTISDTDILAQIRSRVGDVFDASIASDDCKRITELPGIEYSYYSTSVADDKIALTFVVAERNIVRSIDFVGNAKLDDKQLKKKLDFKIGDFLDPIVIEQGRKNVLKLYHDKGYAFAQIVLDEQKLTTGEVVCSVQENHRVKIRTIKFIDNKAISRKKLKKALKTKRKKFFFWSNYYNRQKIEDDVAKLQQVYQDRGCLDSHIDLQLHFSQSKDSVDIVFVIDEGPVYTISSIDIKGSQHFTEQELLEKLKLKQGMIHSPQKVSADVKKLLEVYREVGFIDVQVQSQRLFVSDNQVKIEYDITEGERFRIGQIKISGNQDTQDKVIRRVLDEYEFQPGRWYNADIARGDGTGFLETMITRSALTQSATITPTGEQPGQRDAQVDIMEGQTGSIMLGAGVGSDSGVIGQLVFEQRNFDISDKPESFEEFITGRAFKGAGQIMRIALEPGTEISQYSISFTEPYLKDKPISLNVTASSWERWRESYDEGRLRGYVNFEKRQKDKWRKRLSFRVEDVDVDDLDTDAPQEIIDVKGGNFLVGVKLGVGRDMTDNRFEPSSGYDFDLSYEQLTGDFTFGILSSTYRDYRTVYTDLADRKTILATRFQAATTVSDAPPFEKFYAGGQGSIRGFDYRGVSTRGLQTGVASPERKDPIGSDWMFLAGTELVTPLVGDTMDWLLFVDSGAIDTGNYRASVGIGIQIKIPHWFGPIPMRFELAAPIMKDDDDETQAFSFSVGRLF